MSRTSLKTTYIKGVGRSSYSTSTSTISTKTTGPGLTVAREPVYNWQQELLTNYTDGSTTKYTLLYTPLYPKSVKLYINGLINRQGIDYDIDGKTITFDEALPEGFNILVTYIARDRES